MPHALNNGTYTDYNNHYAEVRKCDTGSDKVIG